MRSPTIALTAAALLLVAASPLRADDPIPKAFPANYGLASPILAEGGLITVRYYGWENTTVYGHTLWAFTAADFASNQGSGCFAWAGGGSCTGTSMFTKDYGASTNPYLDVDNPTPPLTHLLTWVPGTEIIFALQVYMPDVANDQDYWMWYFSGPGSRNPDQLAHVAYFGTGGVPGNQGVGTIPGTEGLHAFGFEDVYYTDSDWDFDNAIFALDNISPPTEVVPEPATMTLVGSGLLGLAAARRRRRLERDG